MAGEATSSQAKELSVDKFRLEAEVARLQHLLEEAEQKAK